MPQNVPEELSRTIETLYRSESGRILATLARLLGDVAVHDFLAEHGLSERGLAMLGLFLRTVVAETGSLPAAYEDDQP